MSAVLQVPQGGLAAALAHVLAAWRSLRGRELAWFALIGLLYGLIDLSALLEIPLDSRLPQLALRHLLVPLLSSLLVLLVWLPAERSDAQSPRRNLRLATATLLGAGISMALMYALIPLLPWPTIYDLMRAAKGLPPDPGWHWVDLLGDILAVLMPAALGVATMELRQRQRRSEVAVQSLLAEQSQLRRRAMAARLATLQAQVEPQLLFDALVDIERAYAESQGEASARMDRLIRHLRVALPRLRDSGTTTLEAEAELLDSYLAVLQDLHQTPMRFEPRWPDALRGASLPPMLLLPLLQRALRLAPQPPGRCCLQAAAMAQGGLRIELGFDRPGLCGNDEELQALSERLRVLSGGTARLHCQTLSDHTLFTLELLHA